MYSKAQASHLKKEFWTRFGMYMKPVKNAENAHINWVNYKTGINHIYFRMDASPRNATIAIELKHRNTSSRNLIFEQLQLLKPYFQSLLSEEWVWQEMFYDEDGSPAARIFCELNDVSVFNKDHWPSIISFFKERMVKLDLFWNEVKTQFE